VQSYKNVKVLFNLAEKLNKNRTVAHFSIKAGQKPPISMHHIFTFLSAVFLFTLSAFAPLGEKPVKGFEKPISGLDEVIGALRSGNATELAKYVDDNIEIALPDKTDTYSRAQALMVLQDFFANNGVRSFEINHKGDNGGNSQFCIGTLQTKAGAYRTTILMKTKNGRQLVKQIRFQSV